MPPKPYIPSNPPGGIPSPKPERLKFRVKGLGFRIQGLGFRVLNRDFWGLFGLGKPNGSSPNVKHTSNTPLEILGSHFVSPRVVECYPLLQY